MADLISDLASKCQINSEMAQKGLQALLGALKHGLPAENFAKIESAFPGAAELLGGGTKAGEGGTTSTGGGGLLAGIKNLASKIFGGGGGGGGQQGGGGGHEALASHFGEMGFTSEQYGRFMPQVTELLKSKLPPDVMEKVSALLPHEEPVAH
jgi:hypothetical protein